MKINSFFFRVLFFITISMLAACGGGGGENGPGIGDMASDGSLTVSPGSLEFTAEQYGYNPDRQYISYSSTNRNSSRIGVGIPPEIDEPDWLDYGIDTSSNRIWVAASQSRLSPGTYTTTLRVLTGTYSGAITDYKDVGIKFNVEKQRAIDASPSNLKFSETEMEIPAAQTILLSNTGDSMPEWTASVKYYGAVTGWISLTPDADSNSIDVKASALGAGTYSADIFITYKNGGGTQVKLVPVTYTVDSIATISKSSFSFDAIEGEVPTSESLSVSFGSLNTSWEAEIDYQSGTDWLEIVRSGNELSIQPSAQLPGTYSANVLIKYSLGDTPSTITIPVTYSVAEGVSVSLPNINFNAYEGDNIPPQALTISYTGNGDITGWSVDSSSSWLEIDNDSGTSFPATVNINPTVLSWGNRSTTLTIQYRFGDLVGTKRIPVTAKIVNGVNVSQDSINFSAFEGSQPEGVDLKVSNQGSGDLSSWSVSVDYWGSAEKWLNITPKNGNSFPVDLNIIPDRLSSGTYSAKVTISYRFGSIRGSKTVSVSYKVDPVVSLSRNSISIEAIEGEDPEPLTLTITQIEGVNISSWEATISNAKWLSLTNASGSSLPATINIDAAPMVRGNYWTNLNLRYSVNGFDSEITVPVYYNARQGVSLGGDSILRFSAIEGLQPDQQSIEVQYTGNVEVPWSAYISYKTGEDWLEISSDSGTTMPATIYVLPKAQLEGSYAANVVVSYEINGKTEFNSVRVEYRVNSAWSGPVPSSINFSIEADTTIDNLKQTVQVYDRYSGENSIQWSATSDVAWLSVSPETGDTDINDNDILTVSIVETELPKAVSNPNGNITLTATNKDLTPLVIPVSVTFSAPYISNVSPYVRYTGKQSKVILRGKGFESISLEDITFGGVPVETGEIISDTEAIVFPPANVLEAAGIYPLDILNASELDLSKADLVVVGPTNYSATSIPLPASPRTGKLIYDAERKAIFYTSSSGIHKIAYSSEEMWNSESMELEHASGINLSADGLNLEVVTATDDNNTLYIIDPDTLIIKNYFNIKSNYLYSNIAPMNNDKTILVNWDGGIMVYPDMIESRNVFDWNNTAISANRDTLLLLGSWNKEHVYRYDASDSSTIEVISGLSTRKIAISEHGERIVVGKNIFDSTFSKLGEISLPNIISGLAVSPDGSKAYLLSGQDIYTFDISGNAPPFRQIVSTVTYTDDTSFYSRGIVVSEDGETLFIYGSSMLYIVPAPKQ